MPSPQRPGRSWTVRLTGHGDRTASVTCSSACAMPPRSRDLAALRRFAEAHAHAHAKAATVHDDAACQCRRQQCAAHEESPADCAGRIVLVLRHDPAVGQVWALAEVCASCAASTPHTRIMSRSLPRAAPAGAPPERQAPAPAVAVPGGFSAPPFASGETPERSGPRRRVGGPRRRARG
ncbi:hypothetical protein [Streptomyces sp. NPDC046985]|uniref:hypothetical protein n=1 Tax=Streptomyces sp. NPDC046985 TaxID=3155377 RepID=UPI0033F21B7F